MKLFHWLFDGTSDWSHFCQFDAEDPGGGTGHSEDDDELDLNEADLEAEVEDLEGETEEEKAERLKRKAFRFKSQEDAEKGYTELQAEKDRLGTRLSTMERELQELKAEREPSQPTQEQLREAQKKKRRQVYVQNMTADLAKLDRNDPDYTAKYYDIKADHDQRFIEQENRLLTQDTYTSLQEDEQRQKEVETAFRTQLEKAGLKGEKYYDLALMTIGLMDKKVPGWANGIPDDQVIPYVIKQVKESGFVLKAQEDKTTQTQQQQQTQAGFGGTLEHSGTGKPGGGAGGGEQEDNTPGSFITDLKSVRKQQRRTAKDLHAIAQKG